MIAPPIEALLDKVDSKFTLVTLAARRARNINSYFNQLGDGLGHMIPPQVSSTSRKPLSIGFEEIAADKIKWTEAPDEPEEPEVDPEAEAQAIADAAEAESDDSAKS
jgi:DNA-directed RNA polymerase subunit omega